MKQDAIDGRAGRDEPILIVRRWIDYQMHVSVEDTARPGAGFHLLRLISSGGGVDSGCSSARSKSEMNPVRMIAARTQRTTEALTTGPPTVAPAWHGPFRRTGLLAKPLFFQCR
jgi:hypothetical protein